MKKISILMMLIIASMAVVAIGCGSSDSDDSSGPTKEEYIAQADKICDEGDAKIAEIGTQLGPDASRDETIAAVKSDLIPELESRAQTLEDLDRPSGDEDELEAYYQDLDDGISTIADDPEGALASKDDPFEASDKAANEYGFKSCGSNS